MPDWERELLVQAEQGLKVEQEHKATYRKVKRKCSGELKMEPEEFFASIAEDHLDEDPFYYTRLRCMEDRAKDDARICIEYCQRRDKGREFRVASESTDPMETVCVRRCLYETVTGKKKGLRD